MDNTSCFLKIPSLSTILM